MNNGIIDFNENNKCGINNDIKLYRPRRIFKSIEYIMIFDSEVCSENCILNKQCDICNRYQASGSTYVPLNKTKYGILQ